jgi:putative tricarboxylic transport membrane protein
MLLLLNLPLIGLWVRLLSVPYNALIPAIVAFSVVGIYGVNSNAVDLYTVAFFGVFGYVAAKLGCEPAPLVLGFILGPLMEEYFRRVMALSGGDPMIFVRSPISAVLLLLALLAFIHRHPRPRDQVEAGGDVRGRRLSFRRRGRRPRSSMSGCCLTPPGG